MCFMDPECATHKPVLQTPARALGADTRLPNRESRSTTVIDGSPVCGASKAPARQPPPADRRHVRVAGTGGGINHRDE